MSAFADRDGNENVFSAPIDTNVSAYGPFHEPWTNRAEMLETILEASPAFIHVWRGPDFTFEFANEAYYRLVGRRGLIGWPALEAFPEAAAGG